MAREETLDDLLRPQIEAGTLTAWCEKHHLQPYTVFRLRNGVHRANAGTVALLALALGVSVKRVRAALELTRRQAT